MTQKILLIISACLLAINLSANTIIITSSADSGAGTLREAITNANNGDVIVFAENVTTVQLADVIVINKNITISGNETNNTILQTWTSNTYKKRYFEILENAELTLNHLTLKDHVGNCSGGAIVNEGKLTLNYCIFSNNRPFDNAGAILNHRILNVENSTFIDNYAPISGGAISNYGIATIDNCIFKSNKAGQSGGAIQNNNQISISNSVFCQNEAASDGIFRNSSFVSTKGTYNAQATLINCLFTNNAITGGNAASSSPHCIISNYNYDVSDLGHLTLINCTVADNTGVGVTFWESTTVLYNTVLWNNVSKFNDQYDICKDTRLANNGIFNAYNSLIGTSNIDLSGNNNIIGENPLFVGNGDYSLQENSPAIDNGNNLFLPVEITKDLLGNPRISNTAVDMGAYEFQYEIYYTVTFAGNNISIVPQIIEYGSLATLPAAPERENYTFGGWFTDNGVFANEWHFDTDIVTQDTTLYAKWNSTSGITEIESTGVKIYPNPVKDVLIIESGELKIESVEIYSIAGQLLQSKIVNLQSDIIIDIAHLSSGTYFLKMQTASGELVQKVIKE